NNNLIQVFEYELLKVEDKGFQKKHWEALGRYNEEHGGRFFRLTPWGVKFSHYVGVIQVGALTIEILPKIGRERGEEEKARWQKVLIDMLRECRWMHVYAHEKAYLRFKPNSILEAYLELFIRECEEIYQRGLVKKYRFVSNNTKAWKGKMLFHQQIQTNLIHQERFFTRHQVYDRENIFNQILYKALRLVPLLSQSPYLKDRVYNLLLSFPELKDIPVNEALFRNLVYDRKTEGYKEAIEIAAMLLLNFRPDISSGDNHLLAILFDMNDMWEEYIFRQLLKNKEQGWTVWPQRIKTFWKMGRSNRKKTIRPDIVITAPQKTIIIDTKWKIPENNIPDDGDLKQMFVYNEYWSGDEAVLVYPDAAFYKKPVFYEGYFAGKNDEENLHGCGILKVSVLDKEKKLDTAIGQRINGLLKEKVFV
ncbi:MAG TPA: restriction endonuclease, partial [Candidatus Aminicenantes bacterium]|nr:restriction endonuclease [Candidatus Aminicenantes bacterium]